MNLDVMFSPKGVAVFGSAAPGKLANVLVHRLIEGGMEKIYAVNPKGLGVDDIPGYTSVLDIKDDIDLAVIAAPAKTVAGIMEECGQKGIRAAVIISSGFSEAGNSEGEEEVMAIARRYGIRCVGPNCAGLVNTHGNLVATLETMPPKGSISMISQSGAVGGSFMALSNNDGVGIAKFLSYGNGADLTVIDLLKYLRDDDETKVVALYLESVKGGREFMDAVKDVAMVKPVVVVKSGRTSLGQRAAMSHTGSLAGSDSIFDAALKQCGAIRVDTLKELFEVCKGFSLMPPMNGSDVAVVTNSGGPGVMTTDKAEKMKLNIPETSEALRTKLAEFLPSYAGMKNPVDITVEGTGEQYGKAIETMLSEMDGSIVIYVGTPYLKAMPVAEGIVSAAKNVSKPICAIMQVGIDIDESIAYLRENSIPCYEIGENAVYVLSKMAQYYTWKKSAKSGSCFDIPEAKRNLFESSDRLLEPEAMALLKENNIPTPNPAFVTTREEAMAEAAKRELPVVMKVVSPQIIHKSDVGGVILNVKTPEEAGEAFDRLAKVGEGKDFRGALMCPMLKSGKEVILGLTKDKQFGPVIAFGMGGIYTEVLKDVTFRIAPVDAETAKQMISEIRMYPLLKGVRGEASCDLDALAQAISEFSKLPFRYPDLNEADLNPIFLYEDSLCAVDARILGAKK
ncbi:MAG: acetate--CoA ligase family protein [Huintestinicola sp.]